MNPRSRAVLAVAGLGAVTVLVLAVVLAQPTLAPSPTPSAAILTSPGVSSAPATSASPGPTVVASSTLPPAAGAYGLISRQGTDPRSPMIIRTESDATPIRTLPSFGLVSDGSRVAYWLENTDGTELHILELSSGNDRIIARFPERRGIGVAWSTDGTGCSFLLTRPVTPSFTSLGS